MSTLLNRLMHTALYLKPVAEGEGGAGAPVDRGDDFEPSADDEDDAPAAKPTAAELEAERAKLGLGAKKEAKADDADEDEDDEADDKPAAKNDKGDKKDSRIPRSRHEAILQKARERTEALEAQVEALQKGQAVQVTNAKVDELEAKVTELEKQHAEANAEGETAKATALMKEIRHLERQVIEQRAEVRSQQATAAAVEQVRFSAVVERLEAAYPQLNPDNPDEYDAEQVAEIMELQEAYVLKGYTGSAALQRAVSKLIKPSTSKQEAAASVTPRVSAEDAAKAAKAERSTAARKLAVEAAGKQPASIEDVGMNSDTNGGKLDAKAAIKMPMDKFNKLTEEDLARMRGDTL